MADKIQLKPEEEAMIKEGLDFEVTLNDPGFKVIEGWLKDMAYHSWIDPRESNKEEWEWRELNAFHAANIAQELLERINKSINTAKYLVKKKNGEVGAKPFKLI